ncbi:hypothetical protein SISSUDRAFT_1058308 [Sistotremastrum suecicum HHB10207 ss-3]|uniref:Uncharacterized protein n=1 Tax=Sistotremastrum suecicum HHB10207 ss-3 TaxID=1314776 RepID=A0A166HLJ4_9AGAM|nr:hypothetical protein SISSUDRAFT_1058308 [Sistotremastrum suecicum HHB10207 ss-3]
MSEPQVNPTDSIFWKERGWMSVAEHNKLRKISEKAEKASQYCSSRWAQKLKSMAELRMVGNQPSLVVQRPPPEIITQFILLERYKGTVFMVEPSLYRVQISDVISDSPVLENESNPLPFQAFRTTQTAVANLWVPCWTESRTFEENDLRRVYYTFDALHKMMFMDRQTKICLLMLSMKVDVNFNPVLSPHIHQVATDILTLQEAEQEENIK